MQDQTKTTPLPQDKPFVPPSAYNDLSGATLAGYRLVRKIAQGGMGVIYEAVQIKLARKVALKVLSEQLATRPEFLARFEREAKAAAALNHPNVVQVHDFGEADGRHFIIMEYVEGENLSAYVQKRGKIPIENALAIIEQAAIALKAASEKSIVHRDIKPSNLMLTPDGRVKVADLGLAKILTEDSELTMSSVSIGSPHFIAPEQADSSKTADHRVDIYSLGVTLLYLLTGKYAYDGESPISIVIAHTTKPLPSGAELGTELPQEIEGLIRRMAAKNPDDRYQNYDDLIADLHRVKQGLEPIAAPPPQAEKKSALVREPVPSRSDNKLALAISVLAVVVLMVGGLIAFAISKSRPPHGRPGGPNRDFAQTRLAPGAPPVIENQNPPPSPQNNLQPPAQQQSDNFQPPQPQPQGGGQNLPLMLLIGALDANHDRVIDANEIANAAASLKSLDRNHDGKLEPDEYLTAADRANNFYKLFRIVMVLQPDANGVIGSNEIANAAALLKQLDMNGDGKLTPDEFGPAGGPPQGGGNPQGGPPSDQALPPDFGPPQGGGGPPPQ
jgi:serine/threonine protein kinase